MDNVLLTDVRRKIIEDKKLYIFSNYMSDCFKKMSPNYYENPFDELEEMSIHKKYYDDSLVFMIQTYIDFEEMDMILSRIIKYYEGLEEFEICSYLKNISDKNNISI